MKKTFKILSIDGGGIKGIYSAAYNWTKKNYSGIETKTGHKRIKMSNNPFYYYIDI